MTAAWGVALPGLAMNAHEIPLQDQGLIALQNPEVGDGVKIDSAYTLYDIAEIHLQTILELLKNNKLTSAQPWIIGMSMGGMVNSILASHLRSQLPADVHFGFLVTTPNLKSNPAIPETLLAEWMTARPGQVNDFERILKPFLSPTFAEMNPVTARSYYEYRALGHNKQSPKAFMRQMTALRSFDGSETFKNLNPDECHFVGGQQDLILGPTHNRDLKTLVPQAHHLEIENLGHMVNLEQPQFFNFRGK